MGVLWWTGETGPFFSSALTTTTVTQALPPPVGASPPSSRLCHPIPRIPAADFDPQRQYYQTLHDEHGTSWRYETPVIIEHVVSTVRREQLTDALIAQCGDSDVTLQRQHT